MKAIQVDALRRIQIVILYPRSAWNQIWALCPSVNHEYVSFQPSETE